MLHDPCWDDINDSTFQNPCRMRGALGAKWLIGPIICKEFRLCFLDILAAVQWSRVKQLERPKNTNVWRDKKKNNKRSQGLFVHSTGRQSGALSLWSSLEETTVRLLSLSTKNGVIFTLLICLSNFCIELLLLSGLFPPGWPMCK